MRPRFASEARPVSTEIWVREFEDDDAEEVRELFVRGICHGNNSTREIAMASMLTEPITVVSYPTFGLGLGMMIRPGPMRWIGGVLSAASALWVYYWRNCISQSIRSYCQHALEKDMADIKSHYAVGKRPEENEGGGTSGFWVAETMGEDGRKKIVGTVALDSSTQTDKSWTELRRMSVAEAYRGKGVAGLLMNALIAHARENGAKKVRLWTTTFQAKARAMYHRYGFVEVGTQAFEPYVRNGRIHELHLVP